MTKTKNMIIVFFVIVVLMSVIRNNSSYLPKTNEVDHFTILHSIIMEYKQQIHKRDELLTSLFGKKPSKTWFSMDATITWYSLSKEECDDDPDTAAHGKSRPFMVAISMHLVDSLNLSPGDRIAVISDDGEVGAVVIYWDQKNPRYDSGAWVDIVAPSAKVAARWAIRPGRIVKL